MTPEPNHAFMLLIPVEESMRRSQLKNEPFPDSEESLMERLAHYQSVSDRRCIKAIDCTRSIDDIANTIAGVVLKRSNT